MPCFYYLVNTQGFSHPLFALPDSLIVFSVSLICAYYLELRAAYLELSTLFYMQRAGSLYLVFNFLPFCPVYFAAIKE